MRRRCISRRGYVESLMAGVNESGVGGPSQILRPREPDPFRGLRRYLGGTNRTPEFRGLVPRTLVGAATHEKHAVALRAPHWKLFGGERHVGWSNLATARVVLRCSDHDVGGVDRPDGVGNFAPIERNRWLVLHSEIVRHLRQL